MTGKPARAGEDWHPPEFLDRDAVVAASSAILDAPAATLTEIEDVFTITEIGLDWDIGVMVYEPADGDVATAPDGSAVGVLLLHGGSQDYRSMEGFARLIASRLRYKVVSMTYPGRLYLDAPDRMWPGDTVHPDGSVRTPIWRAGEAISPDDYELIEDTSLRSRYGTRLMARARPGTTMHARMAGWPAAFETGMIGACRRHLGDGFSILVHGHSTGGPFVSMLSQRVNNIIGVCAIENSPFGYIQEAARHYTGNLERAAAGKPLRTLEESKRTDRFEDLSVRTWREEARYAGPEAAAHEGTSALLRLPELMEEIFEVWDAVKIQANFKCEYLITRNVVDSLRAAAETTADRLGLDAAETAALVARYVGMTRELAGPDVKPVPPTLFGITAASRDHPESVYRDVILPMYAAMQPTPRTALTQYGAGVHDYVKPEPDLPMGVAPAVISGWRDAVDARFFATTGHAR